MSGQMATSLPFPRPESSGVRQLLSPVAMALSEFLGVARPVKEQRRNALHAGVIVLWVTAVIVLRWGGAAVGSGQGCQVTDVDARILATLNALRQPWLDAFFAAVTWLGSIVVLLPAALALAWRLAQRGHSRAALLLPSAVAGAWALAHLGKVLIERPRPDLFPAVIAMPADPSFPSAHAMQVTAFTLAWLLVPHQRAGWTQIVAVAILALLVAISRLYLQVHFPSDVWIGMLVATAWVFGLWLALMGRA